MMIDEVVKEDVLCRLGAWRRFLVLSGGIEKRTLQAFVFAVFGFSVEYIVSRDVKHTVVLLELVV